jgi:recombination protein RecT
MNTKAVVLSPQQQNVKNIQGLMEQYKGEIAKALPKHMNADRMARIALTCLRVNPKLGECDPLSFLGAIIQASALGLEPGSQGHAYLIPFRNNKKGIVECQFIPGYRGLIDLARRSGQIQSISAHMVKANDHFEYEYGLNERLVHKPAMKDRGQNIFVYAVAKLVGGGHQFEVMDMDQILAIKNRKKYENEVWVTDFDEMARKTAIRRIYKYLPTSVEMASAMEYDELNDKDIPQGNRAVIDVAYTTDFVSENPTTIAEINAEGDAAKETDEKKKAIDLFNKKLHQLRDQGFKDTEILKQLSVASYNDIVLKDSKTIYAALEVLHDAG